MTHRQELVKGKAPRSQGNPTASYLNFLEIQRQRVVIAVHSILLTYLIAIPDASAVGKIAPASHTSAGRCRSPCAGPRQGKPPPHTAPQSPSARSMSLLPTPCRRYGSSTPKSTISGYPRFANAPPLGIRIDVHIACNLALILRHQRNGPALYLMLSISSGTFPVGVRTPGLFLPG